MASKKPSWRSLRMTILMYYGNLTDVANFYGVSRRTVNNWVNANKTGKIKRTIEEARQKLLDIAETKITSKIIDGNLTATIFYLKTQGKERGWNEKVDQQISGELSLEINEHVITSKNQIKD